jgi:hypothetical protein
MYLNIWSKNIYHGNDRGTMAIGRTPFGHMMFGRTPFGRMTFGQNPNNNVWSNNIWSNDVLVKKKMFWSNNILV